MADNWLEIDNAPRDGTRVLLWGKVQGSPSAIAIARFDSVQGWVVDPGDISEAHRNAGVIYFQPTHWMPLPKPPGK